MEFEHKEILRKHQVRLVEDMVMDSTLLDFLKMQHVLTASMEEDIRAQKPPRNQARELLQVIPKRGPNAFGHFLCSLQLSGHDFLAKTLYDACRTPPKLLIDQYDDQQRQMLQELCGAPVSGVQSSATSPASSATLLAQSQLANGSGSPAQVSGTLEDYINIDASTLILKMVTAAQADVLENVFAMLGHQVRYIVENNLVSVNASNKIKEFMEKAQTSVVCVVVLVPGDALNDKTQVSSGANLSSVGALKTVFYQAARSPILANKPKFLLQIGFVSSDDQMTADGTDAVRAVRGQADNVDANIPPAGSSTRGTQGTSNPNLTPSGADCCVLQVNLPAGDANALQTLCSILLSNETVSEIARKMQIKRFPSFEETSLRRNLKLKCSGAATLIDNGCFEYRDAGDATVDTRMRLSAIR